MPFRSRLVLLAALALSGCSSGDTRPGEAIGLYTSLPIAWAESADIRGQFAEAGPPHWALTALQARGRVVPLDTLAPLRLSADGLLILAQPRPLTPQENVALDAWVQGGGRVLLLVDPMLTAESLFGPGDPRRPQDIAMLSPILGRWGLALEFDDTQPAGERPVRLAQGDVPVNLPGRFRVLGKSGGGVARCRLEAAGLLADCRAGRGHVLALADAAMLENPEDSAAIPGRRAILDRLLDRLAIAAGSGMNGVKLGMAGEGRKYL
jgi:hypothetical protein